jgi:hypothetical protein
MAAVLLCCLALSTHPAGAAAASTPQPAWATFVTLWGDGAVATNAMTGVSCVSADDCTAIGNQSSVIDLSRSEFAYHWNGTTWTGTQIYFSGGPTGYGSALSGVSCVAEGLCIAVGTFLAQWNGSTWTTSTLPSADSLNGVSCLSTTFCMAVGTQQPGAAAQTLVEDWNGSTWSVVPSPNQGGFDNVLNGITCTSSTSCLAVGSANDGTVNQTLVEQWNGATWTIEASPDTSSTVENVLNGVSCVSPTACKAVGASGSVANSTEEPLIESWDGSAWSMDTGPSVSPNAELGAVSCESSGVCIASGQVPSTTSGFPAAEYGPIFESWDGNSWALQSDGTSRAAGQGISCASATQCMAVGADGVAGNIDMLYTPGYWEVARDGGIFSFGAASFYGSMGDQTLNSPIVGMAATPDGKGYWEVGADGGVFSFGDAAFYGSMGGQPLNAPIVGMAATRDGKGYWLVASDGGIFAFGDAPFFGSMGGSRLNAPIVGMAPTPDDQGYRQVASDGGVFSFGDASTYGSMAGKPLNAPVVGIAGLCLSMANLCGSPTGYYLVASDGGVFAFVASSYGSMGGTPLNAPVVAMMMTADAGGFWEVASDGGVFSFGSAAFEGSMGGQPLNAPIVGAAASAVMGQSPE